MAPSTLPATMETMSDVPEGRSQATAAFALAGDPFSQGRHEGLFVRTSVHRVAGEELRRWIREMLDDPNRNDRLSIVTGETGSGKSHLLAHVVREHVPDERSRLVILPESPGQRTDAQLLRAILSAFGADPTGRTGLELRREIQAVLHAVDQEGFQPGLLIDGADFKGSHLELIRNLLRDAEGTGLWIVLFGTPDLHLRISRRRSLRGLMGPAIALQPLPAADLDQVLDERINAMRSRHTPARIFTQEARTILHTWSEGNIAKLLRIAGACLLKAATTGSEVVTQEIARRVARDLTIEDANGVPRQGAAREERSAVQTQIPLLLDESRIRSSSATTQRGLWQEDDS